VICVGASGEELEEEGARRGGRGRKLHAEAGRADTSVKIWARRDCCVVVSCHEQCQFVVNCKSWGRWMYKLGVELRQTRLAVVV